MKCFLGTIPLWGMLERLEASLPLSSSNGRAPLRVAVLVVSACRSLRTPLARARFVVVFQRI